MTFRPPDTWTDGVFVDRDTWAAAQFQSSRRSFRPIAEAFDPTRDWSDYLRRIEAPVLLVTSAKGLINNSEAEAVMADLRRGTRAHIAHAGHNVHRDNYPDFMAAVSAFLAAEAGPSIPPRQ